MGQRLVMTIKENDNDLMKVYYHWSAYTISSLIEADRFLDSYYDDELEEIENTKLRCIRALENLGARLDNESEFEEFKKLYPNEKIIKDNLNRNRGLIGITEKCMNDIQSYSEGNIIIDLTAGTICCACISGYDDLEDFNECNDSELKEEDIDHLSVDLDSIDFNELSDVICELESVDGFTFINEINNVKEIFSIIA